MPDELGTRIRASQPNNRIDQGGDTRYFTRDLGMAKLVTDNLTFATNGNITGAGGEFAPFAVWDPIEVYGTNLNDGFFTITYVDPSGNYITVDPPPKAEGPIAAQVRTS
jgi:hypothetical protein